MHIIRLRLMGFDTIEDKKGRGRMEIKKQKDQGERRFNMGELTPEIVHKLNTPLASVVGYTELLLPKITDPEGKKILEKIHEEAKRASQIVKDLVAFRRKRSPKKEAADLNSLIEAALRMKAPELSLKNISLVKELSPSIPLTFMDPKQIQKALLSLINNAEEAISEFHGFGEIRVKSSVLYGQIKIVISDDGPGIAKENISKILDPFFTTKGKGIGLGLALSNDIIIGHGGTLRVTSEWGNGATFIITIPIIEVKGEVKKEGERGTKGDLKGMKGLLIDDDLNILNLVFKYLEHQECEVITASDVKTALNTVEGRDFDFVICDVKMPGMGGADFYRLIKEKKPSLKDRIIFITGDISSDKTRTFMDLVTNPCLGKPFSLSELREVIVKILTGVCT